MPGAHDQHLILGIIELKEMITHPDTNVPDTQLNHVHRSIDQSLLRLGKINNCEWSA